MKHGGLPKAQVGEEKDEETKKLEDFKLTPRLDFTGPFPRLWGPQGLTPIIGPLTGFTGFTPNIGLGNPFDMSNYDPKEQATKRLLEEAKKKAKTQTTVDETVDDQEKAYHTTTTKNLDAAPVLKGDMRRLRTLQNFGIGDPKRSLMYAFS